MNKLFIMFLCALSFSATLEARDTDDIRTALTQLMSLKYESEIDVAVAVSTCREGVRSDMPEMIEGFRYVKDRALSKCGDGCLITFTTKELNSGCRLGAVAEARELSKEQKEIAKVLQNIKQTRWVVVKRLQTRSFSDEQCSTRAHPNSQVATEIENLKNKALYQCGEDCKVTIGYQSYDIPNDIFVQYCDIRAVATKK